MKAESRCPHTDSFVARFSDFQEKMNQSRENPEIFFYSKPFYGIDLAYKVCLMLYPGGRYIKDVADDSKEKPNDSMSLYVKILPGEYDDDLPWPFSLNITLILLNKNFKEVMKKETIEPAKSMERSGSCFTKPQKGEKVEDRTGWGYIQFGLKEKIPDMLSSNTLCVQVKLESPKVIAEEHQAAAKVDQAIEKSAKEAAPKKKKAFGGGGLLGFGGGWGK